MLKRSVRFAHRPAALLVLLLAPATGTTAQTGTVRVARENFRALPSGVILAEVMSGTDLPLGARQDRWRQATLEGWVWAASLREESQDGHDLVVSAGRGENLRARPNGPVVARLRTGMRLDRLEQEGRWIRVRRTGWVWEPSLQVTADRPAVDAPSQGGPSAGPAERPERAATLATPAPTTARREFTVAAGTGSMLLESPSGDTLARVAPGASVQVLAREGDWARVRVEGWTFAASLAGADTANAAVLRDVSLATLAAEPDRYRGRVVEWSVQFIALQQAERFRTDFLEGEPFILARGPGEEAGFVYVAVPPERVDEARRLLPLQRVRVLGRIRSAQSSLTGAPVLDLMELLPARSP